ncbi:MAG: hypothetical protein ABSC31_07535 [Acidimicrobiales bacterium]
MPARPEGVDVDRRGQWYFKVTLGNDALTGRREQITRTQRRARLRRLDGSSSANSTRGS